MAHWVPSSSSTVPQRANHSNAELLPDICAGAQIEVVGRRAGDEGWRIMLLVMLTGDCLRISLTPDRAEHIGRDLLEYAALATDGLPEDLASPPAGSEKKS